MSNKDVCLNSQRQKTNILLILCLLSICKKKCHIQENNFFQLTHPILVRIVSCISLMTICFMHFRIKTKSGVEFSEMLFFDDEHRNKHDLDTIGVHTVIVNDGITQKLVKQGLEEFCKL